jgi:NADH:ubiquinone oxidoreductase subunit B-like Fe-S oxidoreductase
LLLLVLPVRWDRDLVVNFGKCIALTKVIGFVREVGRWLPVDIYIRKEGCVCLPVHLLSLLTSHKSKSHAPTATLPTLPTKLVLYTY